MMCTEVECVARDAHNIKQHGTWQTSCLILLRRAIWFKNVQSAKVIEAANFQRTIMFFTCVILDQSENKISVNRIQDEEKAY